MTARDDFDAQGNPEGSEIIYYLGNDSLAHRVRYILAPTVPFLFFNFTYDADKRLTEEIVGDEGSPPDSHIINYFSRGNLDSSQLISVQTGHVVELMRYEYYTDKPNWLSDAYNGISYTGVGSANLLKKEVRMQTGDTAVMEYTYEFDADNRPVKRHAMLNGAPWFDLDYTWIRL